MLRHQPARRLTVLFALAFIFSACTLGGFKLGFGRAQPTSPPSVGQPAAFTPTAPEAGSPSGGGQSASAVPTPVFTPTSTWRSPSTLKEVLQIMHNALVGHDSATLARLILPRVQTGAYATDNVWYPPASQIAADIVRGVRGRRVKCASFTYGEAGGELLLEGFEYPPNVSLPSFRLSDATTIHRIDFSFDDEPPFYIVFILPIPDWAGESEFPRVCDEPAAHIFGVAPDVGNSASSGSNGTQSGSSPSDGECSDSRPPRLHVGEYAYVSTSPPLPNRVRRAPSKDGKVIGWATPGRALKVLDGPVCSDGWRWWKVRLVGSSMVGWTAEGDAKGYWLVPCKTLDQCP